MKINLLLIITLKTVFIFGQCNVTHLSGNVTINNVNVAVTSSGVVSTVYGCENIGPYHIGFDNFTEGDGSYTFDFNPPITSCTLSFDGIDSHPLFNSIEEVQLYVNGSHYPIPEQGTLIECWPLAILTPQGNIIANPIANINNHGGWKNTTINGTIQTLKVSNVVIGQTAGVVFSVNICESGLSSNNDFSEIVDSIQLFPNPFVDYTEIKSKRVFSNATLTIYNALGQKVREVSNLYGQSFFVNREVLSRGIYYLQLMENGKIYFKSKFSIQN